MPPLLLPLSPSSSAFFLAADNQQLPRPFANFHRRPAKNNYKDMDKCRDKEKCKIRQSTIQQLLFQKWSWKEKCPPVAKYCLTLSMTTKFWKFAIAPSLEYIQRLFFNTFSLLSDNAARWCSPALQTRQGSVNSNAPHYEYSPLGVISCAWQVDLWKL